MVASNDLKSPWSHSSSAFSMQFELQFDSIGSFQHEFEIQSLESKIWKVTTIPGASLPDYSNSPLNRPRRLISGHKFFISNLT